MSQHFLGATGSQVRVTATLDDATRRLTKAEVHTEHPGTPGTFDEKLTEEYAYNPAGNLTSIIEKAAGTVVSNQCFSYDHLARLTEAWTKTIADCAGTPAAAGPDPYWLTFTYDPTGNRTQQVSHAGTPVTTNYTYPASGATSVRPHAVSSATIVGGGTVNYSYDNVGNTTSRPDTSGQQTLTWDEQGHLAALTQGADNYSYLYDADGNRLITRDPTGKTLYLPNGMELRYTTATGTTSCIRHYSHLGAVVGVRTPAGLTWQTGDHHGTGQISIDPTTLTATRRKTLPFGGLRGIPPPAWPGDKGFVGGTDDPTGLTHLGAREYDSTLGRFVSVDPVIDPADPQQMNGYAYAANNPTTSSDPSGLLTGPSLCLEICGSTDDRSFQQARRAVRARTVANLWAKTTGGRGHSRDSDGPGACDVKCALALPAPGREGLNWMHSNGYAGSDEFTYEDALNFATTSNDAAFYVCVHVFGGSASACAGTAHSGPPVTLLAAAGMVVISIAVGLCVAFIEFCLGGVGIGKEVPGVGTPGSSVESAAVARSASSRLLDDAARIEAHLARLDHSPANDAMLARIRSAAAEGRTLSAADENFIRHELIEASLMDRGLSWETAHEIAGRSHPTFANYDPEVIKQFPERFNNNWRAYWGIE